MSADSRLVQGEELDVLPPSDPRALRSRADLRRVHRAMCSVSILTRCLGQLRLRKTPRRILELGAGDATLLLRLAQTLDPPWQDVSLTVLDRHDMVSPETQAAYEALGWQLTVLQDDALAWAESRNAAHYDLSLACLFVHHFVGDELSTLLRGIMSQADAFVALEPRRDWIARTGSRFIALLGANRVTREDAVKSVAAGFRGREMTALWPGSSGDWWCDEYAAFPFSQCFVAARESARDR